MNTKNTFQLSTKAAEGYETQKVPALFGPLARATINAISLPEGAHVIDIACGTGIITKVVAERLGGEGRIVGTDINVAMLEVAKKTMPATDHQIELVRLRRDGTALRRWPVRYSVLPTGAPVLSRQAQSVSRDQARPEA